MATGSNEWTVFEHLGGTPDLCMNRSVPDLRIGRVIVAGYDYESARLLKNLLIEAGEELGYLKL